MDKKLLIEIINNGINELNTLTKDYLKDDPNTEEIEIAIKKTELILKELNLLKSKSQQNSITNSACCPEEETQEQVKEQTQVEILDTPKQKTINDKDIRESIGINDKFLFIRELFNGNNEAYTEAIDKINTANNIEEVSNQFSNNQWDDECESTQLFYALINKKFS